MATASRRLSRRPDSTRQQSVNKAGTASIGEAARRSLFDAETQLRLLWAEYVHWRDVTVKAAGDRFAEAEMRCYTEAGARGIPPGEHKPAWFRRAYKAWGVAVDRQLTFARRAARIRADTLRALALKVALTMDDGAFMDGNSRAAVALWNSVEADARRLAGIGGAA